MSLPASLVLAGAGKMGGAMLQGWLAQGVPPGSITVLDPFPATGMMTMCAGQGVALNPSGAVATPQVLVLAIKPQMLEEAAPALAPFAGPGTMVISVLAGKTIADLARSLTRGSAFVRAMPNLPASIGRGITGAFGSAGIRADQRTMADQLLRATGAVEWVDDEALIDAVTAVSGSGPAYVFHLVECLAKAAEAAGLEAGLAMRLARATVEGAGELLHRSPQVSAAQMRADVTSRGGTTAAALEVLMGEGGLAPLLQAAVAAAKRRAGELSGC